MYIRNLLICVGVLGLTMTLDCFAAAAYAQDKTPDLEVEQWVSPFEAQHKSGKQYGDVVVSLRAEQIAKVSTQDKPKELVTLLHQASPVAERALRIIPDADATQIQLETLQKSQFDSLQQAASMFSGQFVTATITVIDVVRREMPKPPQHLSSRFAEAEISQEKYQEYQIRNEDVRRRPYIVVAKLDWTSPTVLTVVDKAAIRNANDSYNSRVTEINALQKKRPTAKHLSDSLDRVRTNRDKIIADVRERAERRKPTQFVEILSGQDQVLQWTKGDRKRITGIIESTAASNYYGHSRWYSTSYSIQRHASAPNRNVNIESTYVQFSFRITHLDATTEAAITANESDKTNSTAPGADQTRAKAELLMANNYHNAGRKDMAEKSYRRIISDYPGTPEADTAQKTLDLMQKNQQSP